MSQPVTVSTIAENVRQLCDLAAYSANSSVSSAMILNFIRNGCVLLGGIIKEYADEDLLTLAGTVNTQADVSVVSMPTNFSDLMRISWLRDDGYDFPLTWATSDEWRAQIGSAWNNGCPIYYRLMGANTVELYPTPQDVYTLRVYYTTGVYITALSDVIVCRDGWEQWLTMHACTQVRAKQQKSAEDIAAGPAGFAGQLSAIEGAIRKQMRRDRFAVKRPRDRRGPLLNTNPWPFPRYR